MVTVLEVVRVVTFAVEAVAAPNVVLLIAPPVSATLLLIRLVILPVVTLAVDTDTFVMVTLPLLMVTFANVMLLSVVTVLPSWIAVFPSVIVVLKLSSNWDKGIALVAALKAYGTVMLEPHS
jgi:hypothetical protein